MSQHPAFRTFFLGAYLLAAATASAQTQAPAKPFEPQVGQAGKDVVWVPTPQALVDRMLDLAKLTPQDFLMDLGSGDGRTVITAAKRGARALGHRVQPRHGGALRRNATEAGVTDRATFEKADLFETDLSKAQVITMFLLPSINMKLRPKLLDLKPGTRIVSNSFTMEDWARTRPRTSPRTAPAGAPHCCGSCRPRSNGSWQMPQGELQLTQQFQMVTGSLAGTPIADGRLRGDQITFTVGGAKYTGTVSGNTIKGSGGSGGAFTATKKP